MENEDGGGRENRRKSLRQSKNYGVVVGGSVSPRRSSRNRTTSPEDEATGMAKRLGTPEMELLLGSCFGGLFRIPALRLFAGKVVHSMMTRQVVTKKVRDVARFWWETTAFLSCGVR
ncbi:hypothetical protein Bca52824_049571 [Brassica carinata]|uniref:Uncharacterized protein n=1 Tax=Brassica carinata TaxID=52824 RepID=A0A8X7UT60_BRACI|nr:hypothetical protein Bca52824_049571 [Brassica carinata]